jgi:hypothetical protein
MARRSFAICLVLLAGCEIKSHIGDPPEDDDASFDARVHQDDDDAGRDAASVRPGADAALSDSAGSDSGPSADAGGAPDARQCDFFQIPVGSVRMAADSTTAWQYEGNRGTSSGDRFYYAGLHGLWIWDLSNPAAPVQTASIALAEEAIDDLAVVGSKVYLLRELGLSVVDVEGAHPVVLGTVAIPKQQDRYPSRGLAVTGSTAYVATSSLLYVIDVSAPASPVIRGQVVADTGNSLVVTGTTVIVGGSKLTSYDVSNPAHPVVSGGFGVAAALDSPYQGLSLDGTLLYATVNTATSFNTGHPNELRIFDVSNPRAPLLVGSTTIASTGRTVLSPGRLLVAEDTPMVEILDRTSPQRPAHLSGRLDAMTPAVFGDNLVFTRLDKVQPPGQFEPLPPPTRLVVESLPNYPRLRGREPEVLLENGLVSGDLLYGRWNGTLVIYDIQQPLHATLLGSTPTPDMPTDQCSNGVCQGDGTFETDGQYSIGRVEPVPAYHLEAYRLDLLARRWLEVFDVTNPAHPTLLGTSGDQLQVPSGMAVHGRYAYVADDTLPHPDCAPASCGRDVATRGVVVYDLSDPMNITRVGSIVIGSAYGVALDGDTLFVSTPAGIAVLSLADPVAPEFLTFDWEAIGGPFMLVRDHLLYAGNVGGLLHIIDVHDPSQPFEIGATNGGVNVGSPSTDSWDVLDAFVFLGDQALETPFNVWDISDLAHPRVVSADYYGGAQTGVAAVGNMSLLFSDQGLWVVDRCGP